MKSFLKVQIVKLVVHFAILWWLMRNEANKLTKKKKVSLIITVQVYQNDVIFKLCGYCQHIPIYFTYFIYIW